MLSPTTLVTLFEMEEREPTFSNPIFPRIQRELILDPEPQIHSSHLTLEFFLVMEMKLSSIVIVCGHASTVNLIVLILVTKNREIFFNQP
jgi:hypothetical protein